MPSEPPRVDPRNRLGGVVRNRNQHPGEGQGQHLAYLDGHPHGAKGPRTRVKELGGAGASVPDEDLEERKAAVGEFRELMTPARRRKLFRTLFEAATEHKNIMAARVLLGYDMGLPVAATEHKNVTPVTGANVRKTVEAQLEAERKRLEAAGVDTTMIDRVLGDDGLWDADIAPPASAPEA